MEKNKLILNLSNNQIVHSYNKIKLVEIIFIRAFCSMGILLFHYFCHSNSNLKFFFKTANSTWGFMFTTTFFCISGSVLYFNYPKIISLKKYYYKRWKSIYPAYYICFLYFFFANVFETHKLFYNGHWTKLFYTLIGLDGYLSYRLKTYFISGEWFLGAIILIYILYPILLFLININILFIFLITFIGYFLMYKANIFIIIKDMNLFTCIISFCFGIITIKYKRIFYENKIIFCGSLFLLILFCFIKLNAFILIFQLQGFFLYISLIHLGSFIMSKRKLSVIKEISKISYSIFLIHHRLIINILALYNPFEWYFHVILIPIAILSTILCSLIHSKIIEYIFTSCLFKRLDAFFIN